MFLRICYQNREGIDRNRLLMGPWWLRGAFCSTMRASGALLRVVEGFSGGNVGVPGCKKRSFRSPGSHLNTPRPPTVLPNAPKGAKHEPQRVPKYVEEHLHRGNADFRPVTKSRSRIKVFKVGGPAGVVKLNTKGARGKQSK